MELSHVGAKCQKCRRLDFVPMSCPLCKGVFCEHHGSLSAHSCPYQRQLDARCVKCPICKVIIRVSPGEDGDRKLAEHMESGCTRHARKDKFIKCSQRSCKRKLKDHQIIKCRDCGKIFCVDHRSDHACGKSSPTATTARNAQKIASRKGRHVFGAAISTASKLPASKLPASKQVKVQQLMSMVGCSLDEAVRYLEKGGWNTNRAVGLYFDGGGS